MTESLRQKRAVRAGYRGHVTRLLQEAPENVTMADARVRQLDRYMGLLKECDDEIFCLLDDEEEIAKEVSDACVIQDEIDAYKCALTKQDRFEDAASVASKGITHRARLPKLELRKFSGDPLEWVSFWQQFSASVDSNDEISQVDKFSYLVNSLAEGPSGVIRGMAITELNYPIAVSLLADRYGQEHAIVNAHMEGLLDIPNISDTSKLRGLYDSLEKHFRGLEVLNKGLDSLMLAPLVLKTLPNDCRLHLSRLLGDKVWDLGSLRAALAAEVKNRERIAVPGAKKGDRKSSSVETKSEVTDAIGGTCSALLTPARGACCFCAGVHESENCPLSGAERHKAAASGRLCFICLKFGHPARKCRNKGTHGCRVGKLLHNAAFCDYYHTAEGAPKVIPKEVKKERRLDADSKIPQDLGSAGDVRKGTNLLAVSEKAVLVKTAVCWVMGNKRQLRANVVLDDCSQSSYVTKAFADRLGLRAKSSVNLSIAAFQSKAPVSQVCGVVNLGLVCRDGAVETLETVAVDSIAPPLERQAVDVKEYPELERLSLADPECLNRSLFQIDILVGAADYYRFVHGNVHRFSHGLVACDTALGWVLTGPAETVSQTPRNGHLSTFFVGTSGMEGVERLDQQLDRLWEMDSMGIKPDEVGSVDEMVSAQFRNTIQRSEGGRYYVRFPWIADRVDQVPDNRGLALRRFRSLQRKLRADPVLEEKYSAYMAEQLRRDFIEVVPDPEESTKESVVHYLPHHPVVKSDSRFTKLRVVYDASAKMKDAYSLNEVMFEGPNMVGDLFAILIRFRLRAVGITADIEKAYLMVGLQESQRDCTRFFWCESVFSSKLVVYRFKVVPFGINSSSFLLNGSVRYHLDGSPRECASMLKDSMYSDNGIVSVYTVDMGVRFYQEAKALLAEAQMNLREWVTNADALRQAIAPGDRIDDNESKVLGLRWDVRGDQLFVPFSADTSAVAVSRRHVLRVVSSVFDPLGFVLPLTIAARVFMQKLWSTPGDWDDLIPEHMHGEWELLVENLRLVPSFRVPRFVGVAFGSVQELHVFADASPLLYGAVAYLVVTSSEGIKKHSLLCAKARVSPAKRQLTLPRLELMAVLLATRLEKKVKESLDVLVSKSTIWSDSTIALSWIRSDKSREVFVRNRVQEIRRSDAEFQYVPTKENPADVCTRFIKADDLRSCNVWWYGPKWLADVPCFESGKKSNDKVSESIALVIRETADDTQVEPPFGIDVSRFSSLGKLLRVTAYCRSFVSKTHRTSAVVTADETEEAMLWWLRYIQLRHYGSVVSDLQKKAKNGFVQQMRLFLDDDGLVRSRSRLVYADISDEAKCPILVPKRSAFVNLLIREIHKRILHQGLPSVVAAIQAKYWIPQCKRQVKRVLRDCVVCRRWQGRAFGVPPTAPLPDFRVNMRSPFAYTGVDFAGPLACKDGRVWVCLFTCAATRALHLEVVEDMSTQTFILAVRRFVARRGCPVRIISDNAKTFKLARTYLEYAWKDVIAHDAVQSYVAEHGIKWQFNLERAPWWGGFFERMVGLVKQCLRKSVGCRLLTKCELATQLAEVEAALNSRPITYVYSELGYEALTPAQLCGLQDGLGFPGSGHRGSGFRGTAVPGSGLRGSEVPGSGLSGSEVPGSGLRGSEAPGSSFNGSEDPGDPDYVPSENSVQALSKRLQRTQFVLESFWSRWRSEYLMQIREFQTKSSKDAKNFPEVNEIVLIKEDLPRGMWKMAKVLKLIVGKDGVVRGAVVKTAKTELQRPIQLLVPLEVRAVEKKIPQVKEKETAVEATVKQSRPMRQAAIEARQKIVRQLSPPEDV